MNQPTVLIVGASISGLACAAAFHRLGIDYIIIEKETKIAAPWRNHYERLHLHTDKGLSSLPYKQWDNKTPRYPSRQQVIDYLENYSDEFHIQPLFNTEALSIQKQKEHWITITNYHHFQSKYIIIATGAFSQPKLFHCKGLETFPGIVIHSSQYRTGKIYQNQNVLVVGFGNSACEIAIDLYEQGARPSISVRSSVNIIPRDLAGIPILRFSLFLSKLSPRVADAIAALLIRWKWGDVTKLGLQKMKYDVFQQIEKNGTTPVIDVGTLQHIKKGHIVVFDDIDFIQNKTVCFKSGKTKEVDAIIAAVGYERNDTDILAVDTNRFSDAKLSIGKQQYFGKEGLYFCGFHISPAGLIREISLEAKKIAKDIAKKSRT
ncbi:MAG: NAD(P)/FAD-dependent oxidoreductase [Bacteroidota bacterium]|nr:NAD(P)/FAD-dependent oxidoreductase [Bacteroidota bacterium]